MAKAEEAAFPAMKLTVMGGEFPNWSSDSKKVHWSLGSSHFSYDIAKGKQFADSLAAAKKRDAEKTKSTLQKDSTLTGENDEKKKEPRFEAREIKINVPYKNIHPKALCS